MEFSIIMKLDPIRKQRQGLLMLWKFSNETETCYFWLIMEIRNEDAACSRVEEYEGDRGLIAGQQDEAAETWTDCILLV